MYVDDGGSSSLVAKAERPTARTLSRDRMRVLAALAPISLVPAGPVVHELGFLFALRHAKIIYMYLLFT